MTGSTLDQAAAGLVLPYQIQTSTHCARHSRPSSSPARVAGKLSWQRVGLRACATRFHFPGAQKELETMCNYLRVRDDFISQLSTKSRELHVSTQVPKCSSDAKGLSIGKPPHTVPVPYTFVCSARLPCAKLVLAHCFAPFKNPSRESMSTGFTTSWR